MCVYSANGLTEQRLRSLPLHMHRENDQQPANTEVTWKSCATPGGRGGGHVLEEYATGV